MVCLEPQVVIHYGVLNPEILQGCESHAPSRGEAKMKREQSGQESLTNTSVLFL